MPDLIPEYPEDCIQSLIDPWWTTATDREVRRGQLLWAFVPHVDLEPMTLHPEERSVPHRLSDDALEVLDGWLQWLVTDRVEADGWLELIRKELRMVEEVAT